MLRPYAWFVAPARWPWRYVYNGRCLPCTGRPTSAAAQPFRFDSASSDGCIAPTPGSLRPRLDQGDTFTMGDAHPFAEAIRSRWAMPPLNGSARLCRGPATPNEFATPDGCIAPTPDSLRPPVGRGDTFTMGDAHPFAGAIHLRWAMPPLYRTARLCRDPVIPDEFASPDGCIAPTPDSLRPPVGRGNTFTMGDAVIRIGATVIYGTRRGVASVGQREGH